MTQAQIDFDVQENKIIESCKFKYDLNKKEAVKKLVRIAGETKQIKELLKLKNEK